KARYNYLKPDSDAKATDADSAKLKKYYADGPVGENTIKDLEDHGVEFRYMPGDQKGFLANIIFVYMPILLMVMLVVFFIRQVQPSGGKAMSFGKSRARLLNESQNRVTFADVAGIDEAKDDCEEIIEFLKNPKKFQRLGGRIPKGVLLMGAPGTGKTLLAR